MDKLMHKSLKHLTRISNKINNATHKSYFKEIYQKNKKIKNSNGSIITHQNGLSKNKISCLRC